MVPSRFFNVGTVCFGCVTEALLRYERIRFASKMLRMKMSVLGLCIVVAACGGAAKPEPTTVATQTGGPAAAVKPGLVKGEELQLIESWAKAYRLNHLDREAP